MSQQDSKGAESPTTARPLDFDDEQESGVIDEAGATSAAAAARAESAAETPTKPPRSSSLKPSGRDQSEPAPPPKPPRPVDTQAQNEQMLVEAFPSVERQVIKAVLIASGGQVEPAFNALLGMSDPDHVEEAPPPQPPRPSQQSQMEQDELYARQLAEHYNTQTERQREQYLRQQQQRGAPRPTQQGEGDKDYNFFDDDLPRIRENMRQGFLTTQTKFNGWISDLRKRFDGEEDPDYPDGYGPGRPPPPDFQRQNFGSSQREQLHGIQKMAERQQRSAGQQSGMARQSSDNDHRYDADPHVIDNFDELELRDEEAEEDAAQKPPPKPARPAANPNLFKATPAVPPQSGPVDEVDAALYRQPSPQGGGKSKKWQPLTSASQHVEAADDNDPFSLGDSEDEKEKEKKKSVDLKKEDTERLKAAAAKTAEEAKEEANEKKTLKPAKSVGTRDKAAEDLLKSVDKKESEKTESAVEDDK